MDLYINDKKAQEGMAVKTFRGEEATLLAWFAPGTPSGRSGGRVYVRCADGTAGEYFPGVIGGEFRDSQIGG